MGSKLNEKIFTEIGGMEQGMVLQSADTDNPVLLFLHGGPGSPEIAFSQDCPTGLDGLFTVCWWEQRGSGISYCRNIPKESMTLEQMIEDALAVTKYLCKRFGKEKVYVMGHSWGSLLGVLTVKRAPELFYAYMGIGQVARQEESERLAYTYMLERFCQAGDKRMVRKLRRYPIDKGGDMSLRYLSVRSEGMQKLGIGVMHRMTSMMDCVKVVLGYKGYTLGEKLRFVMGSSFSLGCLWDTVAKCDLFERAPRLEVPTYVFQGKYDYQVSYEIAKRYMEAMQAPVKGFYTFAESAHSPCYEEPEKMCEILQKDVLQGKAELADR